MFGISWLTDKIAAGLAGFLLVTTIALGIGLVATRTTLHSRTLELHAEQAAHQADIKSWAAATATAQLQDQQHADAVKASQDKISTETQNDQGKKLSDARAIAARYVASHRMQPSSAADDHSPGRASDLPAAPDAAGSTDGATSETVVPAADVDACTQAYVMATGWQDWWTRQVSASDQSDDRASPSNSPNDMSPTAAPSPPER